MRLPLMTRRNAGAAADAAQQVFRQFAWNLAGTLVKARPGTANGRQGKAGK